MAILKDGLNKNYSKSPPTGETQNEQANWDYAAVFLHHGISVLKLIPSKDRL